ncbi:MAG: hypothetical protein ACPGJV_15820 [Bacteriovoracaceae bacterium]
MSYLRKIQYLGFLGSLLISLNSLAFTELNLEGNFSEKKYGDNKQNKEKSTTYSASLAFYLFEYTALEFNYVTSEEETVEKTELLSTDNSLTFLGYTNTVNNEILGIGIRQALAGQKAAIRPLISIGYAKQVVTDRSDYRYRIESSGEEITLSSPKSKVEDNSVFGTFSLQFRLTKMSSLSMSVKTVFPAFEFSRAQEYLKYTLGISMIF